MSEINSPRKDINARKIQRYFRKNKILKNNSDFLKLNLVEKGKESEFENFTKYIRDPQVIGCTNNYIKSFSSYKNGFKLDSKVLLTAYLIYFFSEELLGKEQHPMDKGISEWSEEVVKRIADLNDSKEIDKVWLLLNNYNTIFSQWKTSDKSRMIESIIISYYNRSKHIEKIHADKKLNDAEKQMMKRAFIAGLRNPSSIVSPGASRTPGQDNLGVQWEFDPSESLDAMGFSFDDEGLENVVIEPIALNRKTPKTSSRTSRHHTPAVIEPIALTSKRAAKWPEYEPEAGETDIDNMSLSMLSMSLDDSTMSHDAGDFSSGNLIYFVLYQIVICKFFKHRIFSY